MNKLAIDFAAAVTGIIVFDQGNFLINTAIGVSSIVAVRLFIALFENK